MRWLLSSTLVSTTIPNRNQPILLSLILGPMHNLHRHLYPVRLPMPLRLYADINTITMLLSLVSILSTFPALAPSLIPLALVLILLAPVGMRVANMSQ